MRKKEEAKDMEIETVDAEELIESDSISNPEENIDTEIKKKQDKAEYDKQRRAKTKKKEKGAELNLAEAIFEIHGFLSSLTTIKELAITMEQSVKLEQAVELFDIDIKKKIPRHTLAYINLSVVLINIYTPTVKSVVYKIKHRNDEIPKQHAENIDNR